MKIDGWRYYNHAALPTSAPHEKPDLTPVNNGSIWKIGEEGIPLLARWTENFDCGYETGWYHVIKDKPFELNTLKAKRRYEINKGLKYFEVKKINPVQYLKEIAEIYEESYQTYSEKDNPNSDKIKFKITDKPGAVYYAAFHRETGKLCAFSYINEYENYKDYTTHKALPEYEKYAVNAALIYGLLEDNSEFLKNGYITDGERSIYHKTAFQDYLEKYFGFRKAYCKLNIVYNPKIRWIIKVIYPFRGLFEKFDKFRIIHQVNGVLKMKEIAK